MPSCFCVSPRARRAAAIRIRRPAVRGRDNAAVRLVSGCVPAARATAAAKGWATPMSGETRAEGGSRAGWGRRIGIVWVVYWVALFGVMHIPKGPGLHLPVRYLDQAVHLVLYTGLGLLCASARRSSGRRLTVGSALAWVAVLAGYAAVEELTQPWVGRSAELLDWTADLVGATLGIWVGSRLWAQRTVPEADQDRDSAVSQQAGRD